MTGNSQQKQNNLEVVLNIEPSVSSLAPAIKKELDAISVTASDLSTIPPVITNHHTKQDYDLVRKNLKSIISQTEEAVQGILSLAEEGDNPRAYEVASDLLKTSMEANEKLINLHKNIKDLQRPVEPGTEGDFGARIGSITNNTVYMGNTHDLLKLIKKTKKPIIDVTGNTEENTNK